MKYCIGFKTKYLSGNQKRKRKYGDKNGNQKKKHSR